MNIKYNICFQQFFKGADWDHGASLRISLPGPDYYNSIIKVNTIQEILDFTYNLVGLIWWYIKCN